MSSLNGISIGIDLGSTNSSVFVYDLESNKAVPVDVVSSSPLIPSVVSYDPRTKKYDFGPNAKNTTAKKVRVFKAFKMLLSETDSSILVDRRYDPISDEFASEEDKQRANTPENITKIFLKYILDEVLAKTGADYISNLVVGFPEVWNNIETAGARFVLREICTDLLGEINAQVKERTGVEVKSHVEVRTEPECASAFIAKQIEAETGTNYNGNILIIDYGGGTLDITLSKIQTNAQGFMEINVLARQGAGENSTADKQIGNAGIIYMESIIEEAIRRAEVFDEDKEIPHDNKFYAAVNALENCITGTMKRTLEETFSYNGVDEEALDDLGDEDDLEEWLFCTVDYSGAGDDDELLIPYSLLAKCYNEIIAPTLTEHIRLIMNDMLEHDIPYMNPMLDNLKIAVVGGFGRYYPVREQIRKMFNISHVNDKKMVKMSEDDAELAIAHGACLLSEGILKIRKTSRLEIGMTQNHGKNVQIALRYGQEIESGKVYYCHDSNEKWYKYWLEGSQIDEFWINYSSRPEGAHIGKLKNKIKIQLQSLKEMKGLPVVVGFSMDESDVLTMHVQNFIQDLKADNFQKGYLEGKSKDFPLSRYDSMFDISSFV